MRQVLLYNIIYGMSFFSPTNPELANMKKLNVYNRALEECQISKRANYPNRKAKT